MGKLIEQYLDDAIRTNNALIKTRLALYAIIAEKDAEIAELKRELEAATDLSYDAIQMINPRKER